MPVLTFPEYSSAFFTALIQYQSAQRIAEYEFYNEQRSLYRGYLRGRISFLDYSELHWREFVDLSITPHRTMYVYHYQNAEKKCLFRYDNAAHRPELGCSGHKHLMDGTIIPFESPPIFEEVLVEIFQQYFV